MRNRPRRTLAEARERYQAARPRLIVIAHMDRATPSSPTIRKALRWTIAQGGARNATAARRVLRQVDAADTRRLERAAWDDATCYPLPL